MKPIATPIKIKYPNSVRRFFKTPYNILFYLDRQIIENTVTGIYPSFRQNDSPK